MPTPRLLSGAASCGSGLPCEDAMTTLRRAIGFAFAILFAATAPGADAQTTDDLFAPGALHDLRLFMNSRDVQLLREHFQENTYYQADLEWRGMRVRSVAI